MISSEHESAGTSSIGVRPLAALLTMIVALALSHTAGLAFAAGPSRVIRFDEFAPDNAEGSLPANRYAHLGVTFIGTDDGATYSGTSLGDPGNWGLEGTNGSIFSGFNGFSYSLTMLFSDPVDSFSLDASRSNGSQAGEQFKLEGYQAGNLIDTQTVTLETINEWTTLMLAGVIDEVRISGQGSSFHPFGVDNVQWRVIPEPTTIATGWIASAAFWAISRQRRTLQSHLR